MLPSVALTDVRYGVVSDTIAPCGCANGFLVQEDFSNLSLSKAGFVMVLSLGGVPIGVPVLGVVEVGAKSEMLNVNTSFIGADDVPNDEPFWDTSLVENPHEPRSGMVLTSDLEQGSSVRRVCTDPFVASGFLLSHKIGKPFSDGRATGPSVSFPSELGSRQVVHGAFGIPMFRYGQAARASLPGPSPLDSPL